MKSLTTKQKKVFDFISKYIADNEQSPTVEEIRTSLGFKSTRSVSQYLEALVEKNYVTKTNDARSIKLAEYECEETWNETALVPLYGLASCGTPRFYADDNVEDYISVDKKLLKGKKERKQYLKRIKHDIGEKLNFH